MKVKIRTKDVHFSMPVPIGMIGFVVKLLPDRLFVQMRTNVPAPYDALLTKDTVSMILSECLDILKGLEFVHVEASDGTFVSIRL